MHPATQVQGGDGSAGLGDEVQEVGEQAHVRELKVDRVGDVNLGLWHPSMPSS